MDTDHFTTADGTVIAFQTLGAGRPALLLHGFLSSARRNWVRPGICEALGAAGHRVIAPDLRGHGRSDAPTDAAAWPPDILADDQLALVAHLGLTDFDLVGYSLGARTAVRACARGLTPRRLVLGGMGETGIMEAGPRAEMFEDAIRHGAAARDAESGRAIQQILEAGRLKPQAMLGVLAAFHPTTQAEIRAITAPALVILGADDHDNGSGEVLAGWLPHGRFLSVPGDHGAAVTTPEFVGALVDFLA